VLTGEADLVAPVDLGQRRFLRLAVNGEAAKDIDVAGAVPEETMLDEVVAAINAVIPDLAMATDDDRLRLTSPPTDDRSYLAVLPLRYLEVQEYPPAPAWEQRTVRHGDTWEVVSTSAAETTVEIDITAPRGVFQPALVNLTAGCSVRLCTSLRSGETAHLRFQPGSGIIAFKMVDGKPINIEVKPRESAAPLSLPRGSSRWQYLDSTSSRFNQARFDSDRFAGQKPGRELGVFNASRFGPQTPPESTWIDALFAPLPPVPNPPVEIVMRWQSHRPGAFTVNLPADLPARFGGRFNQVRLGSGRAESYPGAVSEPPEDPDYLVTLINQGKEGDTPVPASNLVEAAVRPFVPLGWQAQTMPFRKPRYLTLGDDRNAARIYLNEKGVDGVIEIRANQAGSWGNEITVSARQAGPATFDVAIAYAGARFENARMAAAGKQPPALARELLKPGPIGVLQAKAAGVEAAITRDRVDQPYPKKKQSEEEEDNG
jgi:hypothetical protein